MEHSYYKDRVSAWIDQELPPYEQEALTQHIAECDECRALAEELRQVYRLVDENSEISGGDDYWEELALRTEARIGINQKSNVTSLSKARAYKSSGLGWKIAAVAASVAVLTFVGWHRQDIFQDLFNQETAPAERMKVVSPPPPSDTIGVTRQTQQGAAEPAAAAEKKEIAPKKKPSLGEAAGTEGYRQTSPSTSPSVNRAAPVPAPVSDEAEKRAAMPAPVQEKPKAEATPVKTATEKAKPSSQDQLDELKDRLMKQALNLQPQSAAPSEFAARSDSLAVDQEHESPVTRWRGVRDSLLAIYPLEEKAPGRKGKGKRVSSTMSSASRPDSLIADCLFNLASVTEDSAEFDQCVRQLTVLEASSTNPAVKRYLDAVLGLRKK